MLRLPDTTIRPGVRVFENVHNSEGTVLEWIAGHWDCPEGHDTGIGECLMWLVEIDEEPPPPAHTTRPRCHRWTHQLTPADAISRLAAVTEDA